MCILFKNDKNESITANVTVDYTFDTAAGFGAATKGVMVRWEVTGMMVALMVVGMGNWMW